MIFLGLSGWPVWGHDPAACLVIDGSLVVAIEEERLIRQRHGVGSLPINAIAYCLKYAGITMDEVTAIGIGWQGIKRYEIRNLPHPSEKEIINSFIPESLFPRKKTPDVYFLDHHVCHAYSAIWNYPNNGNDCNVLILDGQGDLESGAEYEWKNGKLKLLNSHIPEISLGYLYEAGCFYSGFKYHHGGKLMALAAFVNSNINKKNLLINDNGFLIPFDRIIPGYDGNPFEAIQIVDKKWLPWLYKEYGYPKTVKYEFDILQGILLPTDERDEKQIEVAATIQACLEDVIISYSKKLYEKTNNKNLCYAGGVALNCVANGKLMRQPWINQLTIPPAANDAGTSIGAALFLAHQNGNVKPIPKMPYWGISYSKDDIKNLANNLGLNIVNCEDPINYVANCLNDNKIVAWMLGKTEFGPRALGHRSILANPLGKNMKNTLNRLKGRELWRPFGISLKNSNISLLTEDNSESPYMLRTIQLRENIVKAYPLISHIDGTTRPQTLEENDEPTYFDLLNQFETISGQKMIVNTSFNTEGKPIVTTPLQAIQTAVSSGIDVLYIDGILVNLKK